MKQSMRARKREKMARLWPESNWPFAGPLIRAHPTERPSKTRDGRSFKMPY